MSASFPSILPRVRAGLGRATLLQRFAVTSLMVFVLIGLGTSYIIGRAVQSSQLNTATQAAYDNLHDRLIHVLSPQVMRGPMTGQELKRFDGIVRRDVLSRRIVVVKVWNTNGRVVYATDPRIIGRRFPIEDDIRTALGGSVFSDVSDLTDKENQGDKRFGRLLQVYIPIRFGSGPVVGAFEIYETYGPLASQVSNLQRAADVSLGIGLLVLYLLLFGIVGSGSRTIGRQQSQLTRYTNQLETSYRETLMSLAAAVDARDRQTELHSQRVTELALQLGRHVGLPEDQLQTLHRGALLHDVGKIGVPDAILLKPGGLTDEEWTLMRQHPVIGYEMLKNVSFLVDALPLVRHHHERWDGRGYPDGLAGETIPITARIFAIVDAFDAITSDRPYRQGSPLDEALERIEGDAGTHFDPVLALLFVGMMSAPSARPASQGVTAPIQASAA